MAFNDRLFLRNSTGLSLHDRFTQLRTNAPPPQQVAVAPPPPRISQPQPQYYEPPSFLDRYLPQTLPTQRTRPQYHGFFEAGQQRPRPIFEAWQDQQQQRTRPLAVQAAMRLKRRSIKQRLGVRKEEFNTQFKKYQGGQWYRYQGRGRGGRRGRGYGGRGLMTRSQSYGMSTQSIKSRQNNDKCFLYLEF
jgi:hypothetical protein